MANRVEIHKKAPVFALQDFRGKEINLSDYLDKNHVVLVFNRGFQ